ncbi:MAG: ADOP family duplicated permease [Terriglobales bacterium]
MTLLPDLRRAARQLRRSPGFTLLAVAMLTLGLGACTAVFAVVNGVLLQPLRYTAPKQLVALELFVPELAGKFPALPLNAATYLSWSRHAKTLAGIALADQGEAFNLTGAGEPARLNADAVTPNLFSLLGIGMQRGRGFAPDAGQGTHDEQAVLTDALWRSHFHGELDIVGKAIALDGRAYTVVGVLPKTFHFPSQGELIQIFSVSQPAAIFVPLVFAKQDLSNDGGYGFATIARLRPGVDLTRARVELDGLLARQFSTHPANARPRATIAPLRDRIVASSSRRIWMLMAAALALLLLVCLNLGGLSLARARGRASQSAIRSALGASRWQLLTPTIAELTLLAIAGAGGGLLLAALALKVWAAQWAAGLPRAYNVQADGTVYTFMVLAALSAVAVASLLPVWNMARVSPQNVLRASSERAGIRRTLAPQALVSAQIALSVVLLAVAGLLIASFATLESAPLGFAAERILRADLNLPSAEYQRTQDRTAAWRKILDAVRKIPGVEAAAVTSWPPLGGVMNDDGVSIPGDTRIGPARPFASYRRVSPDFFRVMGIPLLQGRELNWNDANGGAAVISAAAARELWPGRNPIRQRFDIFPPSPGNQVVGVVGDVRAIGLEKAPTPMIYELSAGGLSRTLLLRTRQRAAAVAPDLRRAVWQVNPTLAIPRIQSLDDTVAEALAPHRQAMLLLVFLASAALLLACMGLYGVVAQATAQRTREIGVRVALGARPRAVVGLILRDGMRPVWIGTAAGLAGTLVLTRLLASQLFGITPTDPTALATAAALLLITALAACAVPARRAAAQDPSQALRHD